MRNISIPASVAVASRGVSVEVDTSKLSDAILAELAMHGLKQKVSDAASQATLVVLESKFGKAAGEPGNKAWAKEGEGKALVDEMTAQLMAKAVDALVKGEWSMRQAAEGVSVERGIARGIMRQKFKAEVGAKSPQWAKFTGFEPAAQLAKLDEWIADPNNVTMIDMLVEDEIKVRAAKAKALKSASVTFTI